MIGAVALGVVIMVVAVIAVVGVVGDQPAAQPDRPDLPVNSALIEQAHPDPGCAKVPRPKPSGAGDVRLGVIRLRGHCLVSETVLVAAADAEPKLAELRQQPDVVAADRVQSALPPPRRPEDPHPAVDGQPERQWGLDSLGGAAALRDLWPDDAPEIRVGVVDSGIDAGHAEFGDRVIKVKDTELGTDDYASHGTTVAGVIGAADDGTGVTGVAPNVKFLDAQYWRNGDDVGEVGIHDEIIWAVDQGARVINASAGAHDDSLLRSAYAYAELSRVVIIPAAGNCGGTGRRITLPWEREYDRKNCARPNAVSGQADQPTALAVGAHTEDGERADFSTANRTVMISAPGQDILSACVTTEAGPRTLCTDTGTSFAAPFVAGAAAILLARHPEARPADVRQALIMTADPVGTERGQRNDEYGYGKLNVIAAAKYLDDHPPEPLPEPPVITAAQITGIESAAHRTELILDSGKKIAVQQLDPEGATPDLAFSADGAWFAAVDGKRLTVVDAYTGRQQSTACDCGGVAFNTKNQVLTAQVGGGSVKVAQYDPLTTDWTGTTYAPELHPSESGAAKIVGAAGDVALLAVGPEQVNLDELVAVWPDSTTIRLLSTQEGIGRVAASPDGRYVVAAGMPYCYNDPRQFRLIDLERSRAAGRAYAKWLTPSAILSCAATSLHFEGNKLYAAWIAATDGVRDSCPKPSKDNLGSEPVASHLEIGEFEASDAYTNDPWAKLTCGSAGVWHLSNGEQLRLEPGPLMPSTDRTPYNYRLVRVQPGGKPDRELAERAEVIVVRPR
ncbi:hypothetical protein GCM10028864_43610 [Microlunatus parietis]